MLSAIKQQSKNLSEEQFKDLCEYLKEMLEDPDYVPSSSEEEEDEEEEEEWEEMADEYLAIRKYKDKNGKVFFRLE
jgi:hypothetical protein